MTIQADANGALSGSFDIPEGVPTGTHSVVFSGNQGSWGEAFFTGENWLIIKTIRGRPSSYLADPLAQTFRATRSMLIGGIDLYIGTKGTSNIRVQLREVENGLPTARVLSDAIKPNDEILAGQYNRLSWPPIRIDADTEYAVVVMCNDAVSTAGVAQLRKWDADKAQWITTQPYSVGVLLSSSNSSTWTPHQDIDLTFRLLEAAFTANSREIDLGVVTVSTVTDLMVTAPIEKLASGVSVVFRLTMPGGDVHLVSSDQPLALAAPVTGDIEITAVLNGSADASPVLMPGVQVIVGTTLSPKTYVTRLIQANESGNSDITVRFEALLTGSAAVTVECQTNGAGTWTTIPYIKSEATANGWADRVHQISGYTDPDVRIRLTLSGDAVNRPRIRKLRAVVV